MAGYIGNILTVPYPGSTSSGGSSAESTNGGVSYAEFLRNFYELENKAAEDQWERELASAIQAQRFEAEQAQLAYDRSQASADKSMIWEAEQAQKAMDFESAQAQLNREWQEKMSNTAYQRAVKDLQAALREKLLSLLWHLVSKHTARRQITKARCRLWLRCTPLFLPQLPKL